ncbi:DUF6492 family protein [Bosea sp. AS-1]|uniref:DUF6492 family protein n=1 Tax=Bosea sp. AS-1 TaxID=2015316 RepID=UPI0012FD94ED|nr:DUF6492 family protein [Bosea sp. AS-1]
MKLSCALATPSYRGDVDRCRLLCASIDRFVSGQAMHYLLVEDRDVPLFRDLEGPKRRILPESQLLPPWLKSWPDPSSLGRRRVWTGMRALARGLPPLRGWHAQQLRKFAVAKSASEDIILFADSDMLFVRPFDVAGLERDGAVRLYRKPDAITADMARHRPWCENAAALLGLGTASWPGPDYINNMVSWRREHVLGLLAHVERLSGRDWVSAIARDRQFSEYLLYGYYVERVLGLETAGHWPDARELCKVYWFPEDVTGFDLLKSFEEVLEPWQVAIGVQSFIGQPLDQVRALFEKQASA